MISFKNYTLLQEGGAGGHMAHPFDLPDVNNGKQLLKKFDQVIKHLQATPAAIKLDGVNAAVKIITNEAGEKEFAMDRGSMKPLAANSHSVHCSTSDLHSNRISFSNHFHSPWGNCSN